VSISKSSSTIRFAIPLTPFVQEPRVGSGVPAAPTKTSQAELRVPRGGQMQQQIHPRRHGAEGDRAPFKSLELRRCRAERGVGGIDGNRTTYRRGSEILEAGTGVQRGRNGELSDRFPPGLFCRIVVPGVE
jgi:hypothetical protein